MWDYELARNNVVNKKKETPMNKGDAYPHLSLVHNSARGWGFLNPRTGKFSEKLDCAVLHVTKRLVHDSTLSCCKDFQGMSPSAFCCTSSVAKFSEILSSENLSTARIEGFSGVLESLGSEEGSATCSFTTSAGVRVNLCPKASPFPLLEEALLYVYSFKELEVVRFAIRRNQQLDWFLHTAVTDSIPMCLWRTEFTLSAPHGFPAISVGEVVRCSNARTAKWIEELSVEVRGKVQGREDYDSPETIINEGNTSTFAPSLGLSTPR